MALTACPTIIRYSAYNLFVSVNFIFFFWLDSPNLRIRNLSYLNAVSITSPLMIVLFSPFIFQHIQSNERSRNGRFAFWASGEVFCERLYIRVVMHVFLSCLLLLFRCSMHLLVCMCLCTYKLSLTLAFNCVGGLVIVVALAFIHCS